MKAIICENRRIQKTSKETRKQWLKRCDKTLKKMNAVIITIAKDNINPLLMRRHSAFIDRITSATQVCFSLGWDQRVVSVLLILICFMLFSTVL